MRLDKSSLKIAFVYVCMGILWIMVTDILAEVLFPNPDKYLQAQIMKGFFYVVLTGILLYILISKNNDKILTIEAEKREFETRFLHAQEMESLGIITSQIVHDLRNYFAVIQGNIDLLKFEFQQISSNKSDRQEILDDLQITLQEALALLEDILKYGKPETEKIQRISVNEFFQSQINKIRPLIPPPIELEFQPLRTNHDFYIRPNHLSQIISNLVLNAKDAIEMKKYQGIKFNKNPKIKISLRNGAISAQDQNYNLSFTVEDNGIGVKPENQSKLFQPFFTTKDSNGGTGLGLTAVKTIIEKYSGEISFQSQYQEGSSFQIKWPCSKT